MTEKTINEMALCVHELAKMKGWHSMPDESEASFIERACNNAHDEVSELHEAYRNGRLRQPCDKADKLQAAGLPPLTCLEEELADIVIRAFDVSMRLGVNIGEAVRIKHAYNFTREYRHGGKLS